MVAVVVPHTQHIPAPQRREELDIRELLHRRASQQLAIDFVPVLNQRVQVPHRLVVREPEGRDRVAVFGIRGNTGGMRRRVSQMADDPFRKGLGPVWRSANGTNSEGAAYTTQNGSGWACCGACWLWSNVELAAWLDGFV